MRCATVDGKERSLEVEESTTERQRTHRLTTHVLELFYGYQLNESKVKGKGHKVNPVLWACGPEVQALSMRPAPAGPT